APMVSSPGVAGTPAAASWSGARLADMGTSAALLPARAGQPLLPPSIDNPARPERPTPASLDGASVAVFFCATRAEDPGFGLSRQERPRLTDDWWLDLVPINRSLSPSWSEVLGSDW